MKGKGMLVLSRMMDESYVITVPPSTEPTVITQTIIQIRGEKVRTGFQAPKNVEIDRAEVYASKQREKKNAARAV